MPKFVILHYLVEEAHDDRIRGLNKFFGLRKDLSDAEPLRVLSLVLMRNPFELQKFETKKGTKTVPAFNKLNYTLNPPIQVYCTYYGLDGICQ